MAFRINAATGREVLRALTAPVILSLASNAAVVQADPLQTSTRPTMANEASSTQSRGKPSFVEVLVNQSAKVMHPGQVQLRGPLYGSFGPRPSDVEALVQVLGASNRPGLVYAMAALAKVSPQEMGTWIKPDGDGWAVTFLAHDFGAEGNVKMEEVSVHVDRFFPMAFAAQSGPNVPVWPMVLWQAVHEYASDRAYLFEDPRYSLEMLTGFLGDPTGFTVGNPEQTRAILNEQIGDRTPMVVTTHERTSRDELAWMKKEGNGEVPAAWQKFVPEVLARAPYDEKYELLPEQSFAVMGQIQKNGQDFVVLYDPWHDAHRSPKQPGGVLEMPVEDFLICFLHLEPDARNRPHGEVEIGTLELLPD